MFSNDLKFIPGTLRHLPELGEVSHLLQFGTSSTRAGGQDDVRSNQLPQMKMLEFSFVGGRSANLFSIAG